MSTNAGEGSALRRAAPTLVIALGLALHLPALGGGFYLDDYYHVAGVAGMPPLPPAGPFSLYTFADGNPHRLDAVQGDFLPWWADSRLRIAFWRPLASALYALDQAMFGSNPVGYHATNLVLWVLLLGAVSSFFRLLDGQSGGRGAVALLGGLLFAVDDAHTLPVFWIAERHALAGVFCSVCAVHQYVRYRADGGRRRLWRAVGLTTAGLLFSETAVTTSAWVVAYELMLGSGRPTERARAGLPIIALTLGYLAYYSALGFGAQGSAGYVSPLAEPKAFVVRAFAERLPMLLMGALTPVPADVGLLPSAQGRLWPVLLAWGLSTLAVASLIPHLYRHRYARFMALGAVLSMLPSASTWPSNRLLLLPTVGTAWVIASSVVAAFRSGEPASRHRSAFPIGVALVFLLVHAVAAPIQGFWRQQPLHAALSRWMWNGAVRSDLPDRAQARRARVLLVTGRAHSIYLPAMLLVAGHPWPAAMWPVTIGRREYRWTRSAPNTFVLEIDSPGLLRNGFERLFRPDEPPVEGQRFERGALQVRVVKVERDEVRAIEVTIDRPLDSPDVWLLQFDGRRWVRVPPPLPGRSERLVERFAD